MDDCDKQSAQISKDLLQLEPLYYTLLSDTC